MNGHALLLILVVAAADLALAGDNTSKFNEVMVDVKTAQEQLLQYYAQESEKATREWAPPEQKTLSVTGSAKSFILQARSTKSLPEVWAYYAGKLGIEAAYKPNDSGVDSMNIANTYYLNSDPKAAGASTTDSRAMATLVRQSTSARSVIVSLVKDGASTLVSVSLAGAESNRTTAESYKPSRMNQVNRGTAPGG